MAEHQRECGHVFHDLQAPQLSEAALEPRVCIVCSEAQPLGSLVAGLHAGQHLATCLSRKIRALKASDRKEWPCPLCDKMQVWRTLWRRDGMPGKHLESCRHPKPKTPKE